MKKMVEILLLRPTQFALGMHEVNEKVESIRRLKKSELKDYVKRHPLSVVRAPNRELYIVDGHHHASAFWQVGVKKAHVEILYDFSSRKMSFDKFWEKMRHQHWCHLFDKFGDGPREPMYLAPDIRGLADDPYRTLAWMVRRENGFEHSQEAYAEFKWANFFRTHRVFRRDFRLDFHAATKKGVRLARSRAARHLPGYNGRKG